MTDTVNGPSRDQDVITRTAVARNGRREVDGTWQHSNVCRDWPCASGVRDQPTPDVFGDLAGSRFGHFGRILAVPADPVPSSHRLPDKFDAVRPPTALLQTDANVSR